MDEDLETLHATLVRGNGPGPGPLEHTPPERQPDERTLDSDETASDETQPDRPGSDGPASNESLPEIGRFVILRKLGEGGMGVVYAAYDNQLDRRLAIKLVRASRARGEATRTRVRREAQAMARLSHPNVVQVYEVGEHHGQIFVAMEFVTGPTLDQWADAHAPAPDRWRAMLDKYVDAARGLAAAHAAGIVHRDFKPANAIVGEDGRVRVLDFGIARAPGGEAPITTSTIGIGSASTSVHPPSLRRDADLATDRSFAGISVDLLASPLTVTGTMVGTPAYMSPEQFELADVDARSDQFSFCVALYEAIYGVRPFGGPTTAALVLAVVEGNFSPTPPGVEVPSWVRDVLLRGLARDPNKRFVSMGALIDALSSDPIARRRRRLRWSLAIGLGLAAIAGSTWFAAVQMRSADEAEDATALAQKLAKRARARKAQAEAERDRATLESEVAATRARDVARVLAARELTLDPSAAAALLREVEHPESTPGWRSAALVALQAAQTERVLLGHTDRVTELDVSRDDRWLASASADSTARVWPIAGGPPTILRHAGGVVAVRFSPDSRALLTASADQTAAIWTVPSEPGADPGEPVILTGHTDALSSAEFSNDGTRVVTGSRDGTARIWTLARPDAPITLPVTTAAVTHAEFSPDDRHVLVSASDGVVGVWSVAAPSRPPIELGGHRRSVVDADFNARGDRVVTASADGIARVFVLDHATATARITAVLEHDGELVEARFVGDGRQLVTTSHDRSAKLWTLDPSAGLVTDRRVFDDHTGTIWAAEPSPNLRMLALGGRDRAVEIWPLAGGPPIELSGHTADVVAIRFTRAGDRVFTGSHDGSVRVWRTDWTAAGRTLNPDGAELTELVDHAGLLVAAGDGGRVFAWSTLEPATATATVTVTVAIAMRAPTRLVESSGGTARLALSSHPPVLISGDEVGRIRIWPVRATADGIGLEIGELQRPLLGWPRITALAIDDDAELIAAESIEGGVRSWRLSGDRNQPIVTGPQDLTLPRGSRREPGVLGFAPDSRVLVVASGSDRRVLIWTRDQLLHEPGPGRELYTAASQVLDLEFSPDSRRLVITHADRSIHMFALDDLDAPAKPLAEPSTVVDRLGFSPDGRRLAGAGLDGRVVVWDLESPGDDPPTLLAGASGEISDVGFADHGRELAAVSLDGTLRIWSLDADGELLDDPIVLDLGEPLHRLRFMDDGRRIVVAGFGPRVLSWYLGDRIDVDTLKARLASAGSVCLTVEQQMLWVGLAREQAEAMFSACDGSGTLEP